MKKEPMTTDNEPDVETSSSSENGYNHAFVLTFGAASI